MSLRNEVNELRERVVKLEGKRKPPIPTGFVEPLFADHSSARFLRRPAEKVLSYSGKSLVGRTVIGFAWYENYDDAVPSILGHFPEKFVYNTDTLTMTLSGLPEA